MELFAIFFVSACLGISYMLGNNSTSDYNKDQKIKELEDKIEIISDKMSNLEDNQEIKKEPLPHKYNNDLTL